MIMAHQDNINTQLIKYRRKFFSSLKNVIVLCMTCCRVNRMMENNCFPCHIRICRNSLFHKRSVLCRIHVIGVNIHKQRIVIYEPVVCSGFCFAVFRTLIRQIEVFIICRASAVMISDCCYTGKRRKYITQISCVLLFIICCVNLISCREKEVNIHFILNGIQRLVPAFDIFRCASCADLRIPYESKTEI